MTPVRIDCSIKTYYTREPTPGDEWDNGDTAADITIFGGKAGNDRMYRDLTVPFDIDPSKTYYLLWADYCTGDSFGSYDNQVEFIDIFEDAESAEIARLDLLSVKGGFTGSYHRADGTLISTHIPWHGYFESLNDLHITPITIAV